MPSDLTYAQWSLLELIMPAGKPGGRPRKHDLRDSMDTIRSELRGGIAWHALPPGYSLWPTVSTYFRRRQRGGT